MWSGLCTSFHSWVKPLFTPLAHSSDSPSLRVRAHKHILTDAKIPHVCTKTRPLSARLDKAEWCHAFALVRGSEVSACGEGVGVSGCEDGLQMVEIYGWTVALWCGWVCVTQSAAAPTLLRVSLSCSRFMLDGLCRGWVLVSGCLWAHPRDIERWNRETSGNDSYKSDDEQTEWTWTAFFFSNKINTPVLSHLLSPATCRRRC